MLTPAYTTMDPALLHRLRDGFMMPDPENFLMMRRAGLMGLNGFGQIEDYSVGMVPVEETSWLENIGDFLGDTIQSVGRQLPALLGEPPVMAAPGMVTTTSTQRSMLSSPVVLIGLGVAAYFLLAPKSRRR